jgi:predicted enzyme related to lactoylglutathione lyase
MIDARFGHVNVIAKDWQKLADFYEAVFGMQIVPPLRDYRGPDLEAGTGIKGAALRGAHLRLPGLGSDGPTLEIYQYESGPAALSAAANRPGYQHIAFAVPDVPAAREAVFSAGGRKVGAIVIATTADGRRVTWTYVTDPEGNILELQAWAEPDE